jgi:DNA-dependent RNA polymerase auxiliary subunit epsilon
MKISRLYLFFFPVVIDRVPARQTTGTFFFSARNENFPPVSFFFPVVIDRVPARQTTGTFFFSARNENFLPVSFFFSGRN